MGIEIRPSGEAAGYAQAGTIIGQAEKGKEERARAERQAEQSQQIAAQNSARQMAQEWEIQKMLLNSQQDFAHEQRLRQADLDTEARAKEWEVDKMEMRSKLDFEQEEKERVRDNVVAVAGEKTLLESPMSDEERSRGLFNLWRQHPDSPNLQKYSGMEPQTDRAQFGTPPWYLSPEYKDTPEGKAALAKTQKTAEEEPIFTPYNVQKGLGILSTGSPESPLGIPLPVLKNQKEHEQWAERNWGPSWKVLVPDAVDVINKKFGITTPVQRAATDQIMTQYLIANGNNLEKTRQALAKDNYTWK